MRSQKSIQHDNYNPRETFPEGLRPQHNNRSQKKAEQTEIKEIKPQKPKEIIPIAPTSQSGSKSASPKVRKFARELGANVVEIPGSQRGGRVSEEDVKNFVRSQVTVSGGKVEKKVHKEEYPH